MPGNDERVAELVRSMYESGENLPWDLTPEALRSEAHRSRIRIPDAKFLVLVAAAAVLVVTGLAVAGRTKTPNHSSKPTTTPPTTSGAGSIFVPNLIGLDQGSAVSALGQAGLTAGSVTLAPSSQFPAGTVVSQNPRPIASVSPGTSVSLVVSSGPSTTTTSVVPLTAFVGSWAMHDGSIRINGDGTGELDWPGATAPAGVLQTAPITVRATSPSGATVTITSGTLVFEGPSSRQTFGPGSTLTLETTSFGLELSESGQPLYYYCTSAERQAGLDQQYCGA